MQTQESRSKKKLPITADVDMDAELRAFEAEQSAALGIPITKEMWVDRMIQTEMKKSERANVTLLVSGLTRAQDYLIEGALAGLGYNVHYFGEADNEGLRVGKEFGNRGQCNPTHFTVGNLVKHLIHLRDEKGLTAEEVIKNYVFVTAGACGPCRFGMYVTEYRKAIRDAGFDGFRVMLFQQQGGLSQVSGDDVGLEFTPAFFIAVLKAILSGDVLNALGYRIRPFELEAGATDRAIENSKKLLYRSLSENTNFLAAIYQVRQQFAAIRIDPLRLRAKVGVIGEFWALQTEGDGNYHLKRFLEQEGGENEVQAVVMTLLYNLWEVTRDTEERMGLRGADGGQFGLAGVEGELGVAKKLLLMRAADKALRIAFHAFAKPMGLQHYKLPDMWRIAELAKDFYSHDLRGGEGHLEVGKMILNVVDSKTHMTVSVKPFGCMPSSGVSDGVQTLAQARFPKAVYVAVETSGDGAANFYSRVQMTLFAGKRAAEAELAKAYEDTGTTEAEIRAFLAKNSRYSSPFYVPPHRVAGRAANLVYEVAPLIKQSRAARVVQRSRAAVARLGALLSKAPAVARKTAELATDPGVRARAALDARIVADLATSALKQRLAARQAGG